MQSGVVISPPSPRSPRRYAPRDDREAKGHFVLESIFYFRHDSGVPSGVPVYIKGI
jgi:hypothetical protein